jgi:hypothetical protein
VLAIGSRTRPNKLERQDCQEQDDKKTPHEETVRTTTIGSGRPCRGSSGREHPGNGVLMPRIIPSGHDVMRTARLHFCHLTVRPVLKVRILTVFLAAKIKWCVALRSYCQVSLVRAIACARLMLKAYTAPVILLLRPLRLGVTCNSLCDFFGLCLSFCCVWRFP